MPGNEKVEVKLPSGETVVAIVPAGMDDSQVGALMRQKHPEYFPKQATAAQPSDDDRSQMAGAMARMPQGTTPQADQGSVRRFLTRALDIPEGVFDRPGEYLNPFSHAYWHPSPQVQADRDSMVPQTPQQVASSFGAVPGRQTLADVKAKNYAGAAGDVLPDLFAAAQFAVPAAGEVMQMPAVSRSLPRVGRYVGAGAGFEAGGPLGAAAGGITGDLAARGLVKLAPRMARSVGVAAPAEATSPATTAAKIQQIRGGGSTASLANQATDEALARTQSPVTTPTEPAVPAAPKPTVNVDDLVSTGRNLGLSPADAKARAQEAITQFPNDENAAIRYMAGGKRPQTPKPVSGGSTPAAKAEQIKAIQSRPTAPITLEDLAAFNTSAPSLPSGTASQWNDVSNALPVSQGRGLQIFGPPPGPPELASNLAARPIVGRRTELMDLLAQPPNPAVPETQKVNAGLPGRSTSGPNWQRLYEEGLQHRPAETTEDKVAIANAAGDAAGVVYLDKGGRGQPPNTAVTTGTYIKEGDRGQGYGKELYRRAFDHAKAIGKAFVQSDPAASRTPDANRLWESLLTQYPEVITKEGGLYRVNLSKWGEQSPAGIVNNPKYVSQRQRSNAPKNQREMSEFKAKQIAAAKAAKSR